MRPLSRHFAGILLIALGTCALATLALTPRPSPAQVPPSTPPTAPPSTRPDPIQLERIEKPDVPLRGILAKIDLTDPRVHLRAVAAGDEPAEMGVWPTTLQTVTHIAERERFDLAINGDFFMAEKSTDAEGIAALRVYVAGKRAKPIGVTVTDGKVWSKAAQLCPMLVVSDKGEVSITSGKVPPKNTRQALSGNSLLLWNGVPKFKPTDPDNLNPRTAIGLTQDRKTLLLLVVDGRSFRSRGATAGQLTALMQEHGAFVAINLDGGGSSTMVHREADGLKLLNTPSDGQERPVANALGIMVEPSPK